MSIEEELLVLSGVVAAQTARIEAMEELLLDWSLLMNNRFPFTWTKDEDGIIINERVRELGIEKERAHL